MPGSEFKAKIKAVIGANKLLTRNDLFPQSFRLDTLFLKT